MSLVK